MSDVSIGLEVHVQLDTATKLFCGDAVDARAAPNTRVCPVCLGLPGALPVTNERAVELAVRTALALECTVHERSAFARKSYFYPDLPRGYQITQAEEPLATGGRFDGVRIRRVHIEEDAARLIHDRFASRTAIDCNRAGTPLVEIVTDPDLESPDAARSFVSRLRRMLLHIGVSDCEMEHGSLRVDANVSVQPPGGDVPPRTELKNLNSLSHMEQALTYEIARLRSTGRAAPETRRWDEATRRTQPMRSKQERSDYRYQAEPDLPPLRVDARLVARIRADMPELPDAIAVRFAAAYDMPPSHVEVLTADPALARYFEAVATRCDARSARSWVLTDVLGWLNRHGSRVEQMPVSPEALAVLIEMERAGRVSRAGARRAFDLMAESGRSADEVIAEHELAQVGDEESLGKWVDHVIAAHPDEVARCRNGEVKLMSFLIGQMMRVSGGRADPGRAAAMMRARILE